VSLAVAQETDARGGSTLDEIVVTGTFIRRSEGFTPASPVQEISKSDFEANAPRTVADFLTDEWLPTQQPPTLEESTYASYARNIRLHVVPYVGAIRLQQLTPMDLNALYRTLLDSGRRPPGSPARS